MPLHRSQRKLDWRTIVVLAMAFVSGRGVFAAELKPETVRAWVRYIELTEARIKRELESNDQFLAQEFLPVSDATEARQAVMSGGLFIESMQTRNEEGKKVDIPSGLVHHWVGSILVPRAELDDVLKWFRDYAHLKDRFKQVEDSRLISKDGDKFRVFLRVVGKSIRTVHFNTEHTVEYQRHGPGRASSKSVATKIAQLENAGTPEEREKPLGNDSGYMWRWNSYWRFSQVREGVILECESISLSRTIPGIFLWLVKPLIRRIPKESLNSTLTTMRKALTPRKASTSS